MKLEDYQLKVFEKFNDSFSDDVLRKLTLDMVVKGYDKGLFDSEKIFDMNFVRREDTIVHLSNQAFVHVKGLKEEIRQKLLETFREGLASGTAVEEIKKKVREIAGFGVERSKLISVTETVRALNVAKFESAKASNKQVFKTWNSQSEKNADNPCVICEGLDGQRVRLEDNFFFGGKLYFLPPDPHPRCKCSILYDVKVGLKATFNGKEGYWITRGGKHIFIASKTPHDESVLKHYGMIDKKVKDKVKGYLKSLKQGKDTKGLFTKDGIYVKERVERVHKKVFKHYEKVFEQAKPKGVSKVVFLSGIPAAGKTYSVKNTFSMDGVVATHNSTGEKYVVLNADDVKSFLPEYDNGLGASIVHEESSYLNKRLVETARKLGVNVVIDGVMSNKDKARANLEEFQKSGYDSSLIFVDREVDKALDAALGRFMSSGRFVPFELIVKAHPDVLDSVDSLKDSFGSFSHIKN